LSLVINLSESLKENLDKYISKDDGIAFFTSLNWLCPIYGSAKKISTSLAGGTVAIQNSSFGFVFVSF